MLGQGMATAWVTATVMAGVTQCSCSDARCEQGRRQQLVAGLGEGGNGSGGSGHESSIAGGGGGGGEGGGDEMNLKSPTPLFFL